MSFVSKGRISAAKWGAIVAAAVLCVAGALFVAPVEAVAADSASESRIVVYHHYEGKPIAGSKVDAHYVAELNADGSLKPTGAFATYGISWDVSTSSSRQALADTLEGYVERDGIMPAYTAVTDSEGAASFPPKGAKSLKEGWYLVITETREVDGVMLEPAAALVSVSPHSSNGSNVAVTTKLAVTSEAETTTIDVTKVWKDDGTIRPKSVQVQLLRDGVVHKTATLSASNGWHCAWEGLSTASKWRVVEKTVPEGYKVSIVKSGNAFSVVNTQEKTTPPPPEKDDKLPQTGTLWWPVPLLLAAGVALFCLGLVRRSRG